MKRIFTALFLMSAALCANAQTKISYSINGLNAGDIRSMKQIEYMPQGNGGANQVWNFSSAKEIKAMVIAQNKNVATQIGNVDLSSRYTLLSCDEGGEKNTFFEITPTEKRYWGLSTGDVKIEFNTPVVDMKFPFAYKDAVAGAMDGTYTTGNSVEPITGNYVTEADAWGSLSLPDGNTYNNVLRIKLVKDYQQVSGSLTYTMHTVRYQYFAEGVRYPVLIVLENSIKSDCNCACGNYSQQYAYYLPVSQIDAQQSLRKSSIVENGQVRISVYPNPFNEELNASVSINQAADANVDIVDAAGRVVKGFGSYNFVDGDNTLKLEARELPAGHYFLRVSVDGVNYAKSVLKR